jgi:hypothetical protein
MFDAMPTLPSWLSHGLANLTGIALGVLPYLLKRKQLAGDQQAVLIGQCMARIDHLESEQAKLNALLLESKGREAEAGAVIARQDEKIKHLEIEVGELRAQLDAQGREAES